MKNIFTKLFDIQYYLIQCFTMKTRCKLIVIWLIKGLIPVTFFIAMLFLAFYSCQKEEVYVESGEMLKTATIPEVTLLYPNEVCAGEDFSIVFSSTCGKIMIERGYIDGDPIIDGDVVVGFEKVYTGLACDMIDLKWETLVDGGFSACSGGAITQNLEEIGTYVYRAKLSPIAIKNSDCPNCISFKGNMFECFMVTVTVTGTFIDDRDGNEYKWVKMGDQIWMAENLKYLPSVNGGYSNDEPYYYVPGYTDYDINEAKETSYYTNYGVLYNYVAALNDQHYTGELLQGVCPTGWHLPIKEEWQAMADYIMTQTEGEFKIPEEFREPYEWTKVGAALKAASGWDAGNGTDEFGFSGLPGGHYDAYNPDYRIGNQGYWWSATPSIFYFYCGVMYYLNYSNSFYETVAYKGVGQSVRCVKDN